MFLDLSRFAISHPWKLTGVAAGIVSFPEGRLAESQAMDQRQPWQWGAPHPSTKFSEEQVAPEWLLGKCWWCLRICLEGLQCIIYNEQLWCFCFPRKAGIGTNPELWKVADPEAWLRLLWRRYSLASVFWLQIFLLLPRHQGCRESLGKFDRVLGSHLRVLTATNRLPEKQGLSARWGTAWIPSRTPSLGTNQWY